MVSSAKHGQGELSFTPTQIVFMRESKDYDRYCLKRKIQEILNNVIYHEGVFLIIIMEAPVRGRHSRSSDPHM